VKSKKTIIAMIWIAVFLMSPDGWAQEEDAFDKGLKLIGQHRYDEAIQAFSTAIEIIPQDYQAYNYRGVAWALKGNYDRALADYNTALEIRPRYAEAYNNRGFARTQRGDLGNALSDYSRALKINPFFVDAYNNKAWVLATCADRRFRNGDQAVRLAQKAVELKPDVVSLDTLAAAYAAVGNFDAAVDTQKKAIQKLLLADRNSEIPRYLPHLNAYKSGRPLRINYASRPQTDDTKGNGTKVSLKKQTSKKPSPPAPAPKVATASRHKPQKPAAAPKTKKPAAAANKPSPAVKTQKTAADSKTKKPNAASQKKKPLTPQIKPLPYTIQVSAYRDPQTSNRVAEKLTTAGDPAFTSPVDLSEKGKWHRVYIGNYTTLADAKAAAAGLKNRRFRYVHIAKKPYTVQIGEAIPRSEARKLKSRLQAKGYFSYSLPAKNNPDRVRVLIGAFESKQAAADLGKQLQKDGFSPKTGLR
jgi:Flp pilus assembly protein TadD/cell division septation protein DedD